MATDASKQRRVAADALRGTLMSLHAAIGLTPAGDRPAIRMLRAAEGLVRTAVNAVQLPGNLQALKTKGDPPADPTPVRRKRPRGRKKKNGPSEMNDMNADNDKPSQHSSGAIAMDITGGGNVPAKAAAASAASSGAGIVDGEPADVPAVVIPGMPVTFSESAAGRLVQLLSQLCLKWATDANANVGDVATALGPLLKLAQTLTEKG